MGELNDRIREALERKLRRNGLERELETLYARERRQEKEMWALKYALAVEQQDVEYAEAGGMRAIANVIQDCWRKSTDIASFVEMLKARAPYGEEGVAALIKGILAFDVEKERAEADKAGQEYKNAQDALEAIREEIHCKEGEVRAMGDCDGDYARALAEKMTWLQGPAAEQSALLREEESRLEQRLNRIGEAVRQGERALKLAWNIVECASQALQTSINAMKALTLWTQAEDHVEPYREQLKHFQEAIDRLEVEENIVLSPMKLSIIAGIDRSALDMNGAQSGIGQLSEDARVAYMNLQFKVDELKRLMAETQSELDNARIRREQLITDA